MLDEHLSLTLIVALALIVVAARAAGELARRLGQPEVLGELLAGVLLGPSALGALAPGLHEALFRGETRPLLAAVSFVGALLLLLVAGLEVDLRILRAEQRPGSFVAVFAIVPSLVAGTLLSWALGTPPPKGVFLGVVLSVTAVSVVAKLLIESRTSRRRFAQVILAGGVAAEVVVWVLVSVVAASTTGSPWAAAARSTALAVAFFAAAMLLGRRVVFGAMRAVADDTGIANGQLSLVLALMFGFAAVTLSLGLHGLLGAFVLGVLLARAPRTNARLLERLEALTVGLFAPVFFVLAGMQVDLGELGSLAALAQVGLLFVVATGVKVGFVALGARLGGIRGYEPWLVGAGMNVKGGTDVVVAILGAQLGLLSGSTYAAYTVVAIVTVLLTPALLGWLRRRTPVTGDEQRRLEREAAERRSYLGRVQRVLIPAAPALRPALAADVVERLAVSAQRHHRIIDVTELQVDGSGEAGHGIASVAGASVQRTISRRQLRVDDLPTDEEFVQVAAGHDLVAVAAPYDADRPHPLGVLQDRLIDASPVDVLIVGGADSRLPWEEIESILVPTNGEAPSFAAGEVAAALAETCGARVTLLGVVDPVLETIADVRGSGEDATATHLDELRRRLAPLNVAVETRVRSGREPGREINRELAAGAYDLVVLGARDRAGDGVAYFGPSAEAVLGQHAVPYVALITHERTAQRQ